MSDIVDYNAPREPDDIDLVKVMKEILTNIGKSQDIPMFLEHEYVKEAIDKKPEVQRFLLNKYWVLQILNADVPNSIDVRYCLVDKGKIETWVDMFNKTVVPFIIANDLPHF